MGPGAGVICYPLGELEGDTWVKLNNGNAIKTKYSVKVCLEKKQRFDNERKTMCIKNLFLVAYLMTALCASNLYSMPLNYNEMLTKTIESEAVLDFCKKTKAEMYFIYENEFHQIMETDYVSAPMKNNMKPYLAFRFKNISQELQLPIMEIQYGLSLNIERKEDINKIEKIIMNLDINNIIYLQINCNRKLDEIFVRNGFIRKPLPILKKLENLNYLEIECFSFKELDCDCFSAPNIKSISLKTENIDKNSLLALAKCHKLSSISIETSSVDLDYSFLKSLNELKHISLYTDYVSDSFYDILSSLNLHSLQLPNIRLVRDIQIASIQRNKNIKFTNVKPDSLKEMKQIVSRLPNLSYFHVPSHLRTSNVLSWLVESSKLHIIPNAYKEGSRAKSMGEVTILDLSLFEFDGNIDFMSDLKELREINFTSAKISDDQLKFLNTLSNLKSLILYGTSYSGTVTGEFLNNFTILPKIESLNLDNCKFNLKNFSNLRKAQSLKCLSIEGWDISKELFLEIGRIPKLVSLNISRCLLEHEIDFKNLFISPTLVKLSLASTDISLTLFDPSISSLISLDIKKSKCTMHQLSNVLNTKGIETLDVSGNHISFDSKMSFSALTRMQELSINHCSLNDNALKQILNLSKLTVFRATHLGSNKIDWENVINNNPLKSISIDHSNLFNKVIATLNAHPISLDIYIPYSADFNHRIFNLYVPKHKVYNVMRIWDH